ncbi:hypothetical protein ACPCSL_34260 [Streptomyces griseoincarnatus]|uniref:Uncharacterized protein n=1 Tax=Streptomyces tunisiensis TaxID=948699 RepID=A0ABP7Z8L5_9ACTN
MIALEYLSLKCVRSATSPLGTEYDVALLTNGRNRKGFYSLGEGEVVDLSRSYNYGIEPNTPNTRWRFTLEKQTAAFTGDTEVTTIWRADYEGDSNFLFTKRTLHFDNEGDYAFSYRFVDLP